MSIFKRVGDYTKKRGLSDAVGIGWNAIDKGSRGIVQPFVGLAGLRMFWRGPSSEAEGREAFARRVMPAFSGPEDADAAAARIRTIGMVVLGSAFLFGLLALFVSGSLSKMSCLLAFLILATNGTVHIHRAAQIRERRLFGLREVFF